MSARTEMNTLQLSIADTDQEMRSCFEVMRELRPHLQDAEAFVAQVRRQSVQGYRLLMALQDGQVIALAGYRLQENLLYGCFLYVDDLVVSRNVRSQGLGAALINYMRDEARRMGCANFVLDTALGNALGQRFYYRLGLLAIGMHFRQSLT